MGYSMMLWEYASYVSSVEKWHTGLNISEIGYRSYSYHLQQVLISPHNQI